MTKTRPILALCAVAACVAPSLAAVPWTPPAGSSDTITYADGRTQNGLFTPDAPLVGGDTFVFTPSGFEAQDNATARDTAGLTVTAKKGYTLTSVSASLAGDYSTFGGGTSLLDPAFVTSPSTFAIGILTLTNPATGASKNTTFQFADGFNAGDGIFHDQVKIQLPEAGKVPTSRCSPRCRPERRRVPPLISSSRAA